MSQTMEIPQDVADGLSVRLRLLQIEMSESDLREIARIVTPQARARAIQIDAQVTLLSQISYALEEGRLTIHEPTPEHLERRMGAEVDMHFGTTEEDRDG